MAYVTAIINAAFKGITLVCLNFIDFAVFNNYMIFVLLRSVEFICCIFVEFWGNSLILTTKDLYLLIIMNLVVYAVMTLG